MSLFRRTARTAALGLVAGALAVTTVQPAQAASISEGFDDVAALTTWRTVNLSDPTDPDPEPSWSQGDVDLFTAHAGAEDSFVGVSYESGRDDVSAWLIMPQQTSLSSTDVLSFWTRSLVTDYPDRLEVRMSSNGSCSPGTTTDGVGDFTTLLTSINPEQVRDGYPGEWTEYSVPLTGLGTANVSGCLALRYYVQDTDENGQYVGIDSLTFTDNASVACTTAHASSTTATDQVTAATAAVAAATPGVSSAEKSLTKARKALTKAKKALKKAKKKAKAGGDDQVAKVKKAKKKVKKGKKKVKRATKVLAEANGGLAAATSGLTAAQAALTTAQTTVTTSCP